jgi:hypothetical protein
VAVLGVAVGIVILLQARRHARPNGPTHRASDRSAQGPPLNE